MHVTIPLDRMNGNFKLLNRFSNVDQDVIKGLMSGAVEMYFHLIKARQAKLVSKTVNNKTKNISLRISVTDDNQDVEFEIDAAELSRNKFLLASFNKIDTFDIGYSAAESRIRTEQMEIKSANANFLIEQLSSE